MTEDQIKRVFETQTDINSTREDSMLKEPSLPNWKFVCGGFDYDLKNALKEESIYKEILLHENGLKIAYYIYKEKHKLCNKLSNKLTVVNIVAKIYFKKPTQNLRAIKKYIKTIANNKIFDYKVEDLWEIYIDGGYLQLKEIVLNDESSFIDIESWIVQKIERDIRREIWTTFCIEGGRK